MSDSPPYSLKKISYKAFEPIFEEGESGDAAYLVYSGEVEIRTGMATDTPRVLTRLKKGSTFGELALILDSPRTAMAIAVKDTVLVSVSRDELQHILGETNPIIKSLVMNLGKRIIELTEELEDDRNKVNWKEWKRES